MYICIYVCISSHTYIHVHLGLAQRNAEFQRDDLWGLFRAPLDPKYGFLEVFQVLT